MKLTKEEAIRIHRDMWQYLKEHGAGRGIFWRDYFKALYCKEHRYSFKNNCALCEYALRYGGCRACPVIWGNEGKKENIFCQWQYSTHIEKECIDWRYSDLDDIIKIEIKGEE